MHCVKSNLSSAMLKVLTTVQTSHIRLASPYICRVSFSTDKKSSGSKKGKSESKDENKLETENLLKFYNAAEQAKWMKVSFTPEELEDHNRIGREYQRQSTIRQNQMDYDLTNKIWLQQEAIRALPPNLRELAMMIDDSSPPSDRPWPFYETPPIKGFSIHKYVEGGESSEGDDKETANS